MSNVSSEAVQALAEGLDNLNNEQIEALFEILNELDPLETAGSEARYDSNQRSVIADLQKVYKEAFED